MDVINNSLRRSVRIANRPSRSIDRYNPSIAISSQRRTISNIERRRLNNRISQQVVRALQTSEETEQRLSIERERSRLRRENENEDERLARLDYHRQYNFDIRDGETPFQSAQRLQAHAQQQRAYIERNTNNQANVDTLNNDAQRLNIQARYRRNIHRDYRIAINPNLDENSVDLHDCGQMNIQCTSCGSYNFRDEMNISERENRFSMCCQKGKVHLHAVQVPALISTMLQGQSIRDRNFQNRILNFNSALAFASRQATRRQFPGIY